MRPFLITNATIKESVILLRAINVGMNHRCLLVPKLNSQPSHGIENRGCVQRRGRSISGQSSLKISGRPTETGAFDGPVFVPVGTTESSPALQCRVPAPLSARPSEGRLKRLARALLEASRCFAGTAVPYPRWHRVPPFKRPSGTRRLSITNPALKCRATFNRPYRDEERPMVPISYGMAVSCTWECSSRGSCTSSLPFSSCRIDQVRRSANRGN